MEATLLFTGGKDSSLSAYILEMLGYEVNAVTVTFGHSETWRRAKKTAEALGYMHTVQRMNDDILAEASRIIMDDGYPLRGITFIHKEAVEKLAEKHDVVCDGSRRDDRTPRLTFDEIRSLEDRRGVAYIAPLRGIGYKTIRTLAKKLFILETYKSSEKKTADYETEIRIFLGDRAEKIFPAHEHTQVRGWRGERYGKKQTTR
jgi:hypothetical protein